MRGEGVDLENQKMNKVEGMWILNGYLLKNANGKMVRHVKLLEVGPEGKPRRARVLRKTAPELTRTQYYEQFLYTDRTGNFRNASKEEKDAMKFGEITLIKRPETHECSAVNRYCIPRRGGFGEIFPCMLCENWAHMGCSYGVEGGRVCTSHVAALDSGEGLAVIISDPSHRLEGTILRPTRKFGTASTTRKKRGNNQQESEIAEHAGLWEQIALYKSIWLAAGLAYEIGNEETAIKMKDATRGTVERITLVSGRQHFPIRGPLRR
eukprot:5983323-Amphidinium_carterae.2